MSVLDPNDPVHQRAEERLRTDSIVWLTTAGDDRQPVSSPVWFLWEDGTFLIFSQPAATKVRNIKANPLVSLHLEGDRDGGDIVILEGTAELLDDAPAYDEVPEAVGKYAANLERMDWTKEHVAAEYSQPIRVTPTRIRAWE